MMRVTSPNHLYRLVYLPESPRWCFSLYLRTRRNESGESSNEQTRFGV